MKRPDYDVLVIGGGPAGIAAAVRTRWVKRYHVVPCKVAIVEPATLGGLTQMGTCIMTGPGWVYNHETIRPFLLDDVSRFALPHIQDRALAVIKDGDRFRVELAGRPPLSARVVVVCCGMKMLSREPQLWGHGVTATSMGIEAAIEKIRGWVTDPKHRRVVFAGSRRLLDYVGFIDGARAPGVDVQYIVEPIAGEALAAPDHPNVTIGTVVEMKGQERLDALVSDTGAGARKILDGVDLFVVDFLSYELSPARNFACAGVALDRDGYIDVDRRQHTSVDGLFAAGDVTGMPACAGTAIGEGIVAGFEAYRYVYREKFGAEPPLFAYYGFEGELRDDFRELPQVDEDAFGPELLDEVDAVLAAALPKFPPDQRAQAEAAIRAMPAPGGDVPSLRQLAARTGQETPRARRVVERLLELKLITLQSCGHD
jgi:thioredoxin reductase